MPLNEPQILRVLGAELDKLHGDEVLGIGQYPLDARVSLRLRGSVKQNPDQLVMPTAKVPLMAVLALVCERGGIARQRMEELIVQAVSEAIENGEPVGEFIECSKAAERRAREAILNRLPKVTRRGPLNRILELSGVRVTPAK